MERSFYNMNGKKTRAVDLRQPRRIFSRDEILENYRAKIRRQEPIILGAAGIGLVAKMENIAGIDGVLATSNAYLRMEGHNSGMGYFAYMDTNTVMLDTVKKVLRWTRNVPLFAGVGSGDPYREPGAILDELKSLGVCGIINSPPNNAYGVNMAKEVQWSNISRYFDYHLISLAREHGMFAMGYVFSSGDAAEMAKSGADIIIPHAGLTVGGLSGPDESSAKTLDETCAFTQQILESARKVNPDVLVLCHGGMLNSPENVQYCFDHTDVNGFLGCSAIDRIPIERGIIEDVSKSVHLKLLKI
jgi:predicted TIM-barrel enzyme